MSFSITAEWPLGVYRGAARDGRAESVPSVARLHAALLSAAGFGPRAVPDGDGLAPCTADEEALRWLEEHPPDGVTIPAMAVNRGRAVAYRDDGTIKKDKHGGRTKKFPKPPDTAVAVQGRFVWTWYEDPPTPVREALAALCADVPYLGTTESPVRLTTGAGEAAGAAEAEPTHEYDPQAGPFAPGEAIEGCAPGRTAALVAAYARRVAPPRARARETYGTDEWSVAEVPSQEAVVPLRYRPRHEPVGEVPWSRVWLVPLSRRVPEPFRVRWAVAVHQALIRAIGEGAPSLLTGVYPEGVPRPVNRLSLHLLDDSAPVAAEVAAPGALAILVPDGAAADVQVVGDAVQGLRSVRGPAGRLARVTGAVQELPGDRFWTPPQAGMRRLWRTVPAAVPDTRGAHGRSGNTGEWTFAHAALLSLGFVFKHRLPRVPGRRDEYYRNLAQAVTDTGAAAVTARPVRTTEVDRYVHRVTPHAVVRPYTACLWLGDLATATTVAALGQSRHLGGGLLMPHDVPEGTPVDEITPVGDPAGNEAPGRRS